MTREEAITVFKAFMDNPLFSDVHKAAFNIAIKALEQKPCCNCIEFKRYAKEMGFEIEQKPKSEWEQDHEILKAYSDGANEVIDKIRAEINTMSGDIETIADVLAIIDKYKTESENS